MRGKLPEKLPVQFILTLLVVALLMGCKGPTSLPPDHTAWFDNVYHRVDSMNLPLDKAFAYIDSVYSQYPAPGTRDRLRRYDYKSAYYFYREHDLANAMRYIDSDLAILSDPEMQRHYSREYAKSLMDKAETYQFDNNYESALFYYRKGLEAIRDLRDSCTLAEYTQRIAMASFRAERYPDARQLFELALRQFAACQGDFRSFAYQQSNIDNIGESYAAMNKWDSAQYYYDSALSFIDNHGRFFLKDSVDRAYIETARAVVYGNQGDYYLNKKDTAKAWELYRNSVAINSRPLHDSGNALAVLFKTAGLHLAQGHLSETRKTLDSVRKELDRGSDPKMDIAWRKLNAEWLARSGNHYEAWQALNAWSRLNDSIHNTRSALSTGDMPAKLVHIQDDYQIQLLKQRDRDKTIYLLFATIMVVMLTVIAFLVRWSSRRSTAHIRQLNHLNKALRAENLQTQTAIKALNEDQAMYLRSLKTIAHDLRNPVGAISSAVSLLQHQKDLNDQTRTVLRLIGQSADQSLHLVSGIMNLDLPVGNLNRETVELGKLLETCVATLQFKAAEKKQTIRLDAQPVTALVDHDKLWRVIINLLDNSIKFSPEAASITIRLHRQQDKAIIAVSDEGIGIPKGLERSLFAVDSRVQRSGTSGEASFGLGLAIVSQIIKAHGGSITVHSEENRGTTFRIELQAMVA